VRNRLKTKEIVNFVCTSVRKRIKALELGDLFHFGTALSADGADWKKRRGTQKVLYHGCQGAVDLRPVQERTNPPKRLLDRAIGVEDVGEAEMDQ
jgi:hypothetical protein